MKTIAHIAFALLLLLNGYKLNAQIVINEVCTYNDDVLEDLDGDKSDWIELYNSTNNPINLNGYTLQSKIQNLSYNLPQLVLDGHAFQIVFLSGKNKFGSQVHTNFKMVLNDTILINQNQNIINSVVVPDLFVDHSYGAIEDGNSNFEIFNNPTPGFTNQYEIHFASYTSKPNINLQSGFYSGIQMLTLNCPTQGAITYYTTNGSEPSINSAVYSNPIEINKTCVINAFSIAPGMPASKVVSHSYFIDDEHKLSVISISTDSLLLYDTNSGLLEMGPNANPNPPFYGANFWSDTQIVVKVQIFDKNKNEIINQSCEMQIHGGTMNRSQAMKSFRLLSKKKFEKDRFYAPLIPDKPIVAFRKIVLRNGSSDFLKSHLREGLIHKSLIKNTYVDANGYEPCVVYINGKYYGLSEIREKIDEYYVEQNHHVDKDYVDVLADTNLVDIGDWQAFDSIYRFVLHHEMKDSINFNFVESKIDLKNMADYFIAETFFDNNDWPSSNLRLWHQKNPSGKFRYIAFDFDASLGTFDWSPYTLNMLHDALNYFTSEVPIKHCIIFKKLLENDSFKKYFINRYADLFNSAFSEKNLLSLLDSTSKNIQLEISSHFSKWGKQYNDWENEINMKIIPYIKNRHQLSKEDVLNEFNLPSYHQIKLKTFPESAFQAYSLNTIEIKENYFNGYYYESIPIWFKAKAKPGFVFSHWLQSNGNKYFYDSLWVNLTEDSEFTAIYFPESRKNEIELFPNPNTINKLYIRLPNDISLLNNVTIINALGEVILSTSTPRLLGDFTLEIDITGLKKGVYYTTMLFNNRTEIIKFLVL